MKEDLAIYQREEIKKIIVLKVHKVLKAIKITELQVQEEYRWNLLNIHLRAA